MASMRRSACRRWSRRALAGRSRWRASTATIRRELVLEDGEAKSVAIRDGTLPGIRRLGYHTLRYAGREVTIAVAPPRCVTVGDIAPGQKLGVSLAQLYSLKRATTAASAITGLGQLAQDAAKQGADAIALSPTHSLFPDDATPFGPYSPSSRLFFNPLS